MKYALITGAQGGIGQALCKVFHDAGYRVIASDRKGKGNISCAHFLKFDIAQFTMDTAYRKQTLIAIKKLLGNSGLSVLINNAAIQILNKTEDITLDEFHETLDTNLIGPFLLIQQLLPELKKANGSVINISSIHAVETKPAFVSYATSKAALTGLTRALAVDLGANVRINAIAPAATATPMLLAGFKGKKKQFLKLKKVHPLGRIATPEEIAQTALFLASEKASFITGATINVDGGIGARLHDPL